MATELTELPIEIMAGTSVSYVREFSDYPADDGWALTLYIGGVHFHAAADGAAHAFTLAADLTATIPADTYKWVEIATKGEAVENAASGTVTIAPNIITETIAGMRSSAETELVAIRAKIAARIAADLSSYSVADRVVNREALEILWKREADLMARVAAERRGNAPRPAVLIGFTPPGFDR
jgi:hypothetical protein